jgi:hypothetical protein
VRQDKVQIFGGFDSRHRKVATFYELSFAPEAATLG